MGLGLVTVLRTDNVASTSRFTVTLIIRQWSTKIGQIYVFVSYKPCKNETRKSNSAIDVVTDDEGKIIVTLIIFRKNLQNYLFGSPALRKQNPCVPYEGQLRTQSKDHQ